MTSGWFIDTCSAIRSAVAADAEIIAAAATVVAAFVIVVKMVRFHYRLSSDEQGGGLSDVSAKDFIWPLFLLFLLSNSPAIGNAINSVVTEATSVIIADNSSVAMKDLLILRKNQQLEKAKKQLNSDKDEADQYLKAFDSEYIKLAALSSDYSYESGNSWYERVNPMTDEKESYLLLSPEEIGVAPEEMTFEACWDYVQKHRYELLPRIQTSSGSDTWWEKMLIDGIMEQKTQDEYAVRQLENEISEINGISSDAELKQRLDVDEAGVLNEFFDYPYPPVPDFFTSSWDWSSPFSSLYNAAKDAITYLPRIAVFAFRCLGVAIVNGVFRVIVWLFVNFIFIRGFMATVGMSIMLYFFPLVFLAMLFKRYKGAFGDWVVVFVELSLWFPLGTIVMSVVFYGISCLLKLGMVDPWWIMMMVVTGFLTVSAVSSLAETAMVVFGRRSGAVPGTGGSILAVAGGVAVAGRKIAMAPIGKYALVKKIGHTEKKQMKVDAKVKKKVTELSEVRDAALSSSISRNQEVRKLRAEFRSKVENGESLSKVLAAKQIYKKNLKELKDTKKTARKAKKEIAKNEIKSKAVQKKLEQLQKNNKFYMWKKVGHILKTETIRRGYEVMDGLSGSKDAVRSSDIWKFGKKAYKVSSRVVKAAKAVTFGTMRLPVKTVKFIGRTAKKVSKDVSLAVHDVRKVAPATWREVRGKVGALANQAKQRISRLTNRLQEKFTPTERVGDRRSIKGTKVSSHKKYEKVSDIKEKCN